MSASTRRRGWTRGRVGVGALALVAALVLSPAIVAWAAFRYLVPNRVGTGLMMLVAGAVSLLGAVVVASVAADVIPGLGLWPALAGAVAATGVGAVRGYQLLPLCPTAAVWAARRLAGAVPGLPDPAGERRRPQWDWPEAAAQAEHERQVAEVGLWAPGFDVAGKPAAVDLVAGLSEHALLVGETGSGKTTAAMTIARDWIASDERGALVYLDLKGGGGSGAAPALASVVDSSGGGRRLVAWPGVDADGQPLVLDPFSEGSADAIVGRVLSAFEWTEPYYRDGAEALVRDMVDAAGSAAVPVDIHRLSAWLADPNALLSDCENSEIAREVVQVWRLGGDHGAKERSALAQRLRGWCRADAAGTARAGGVLLSSLLTERAVVAITAPGSAGDGSAGRWAQLLVRALLQARLVDPGAPPVLVIIDEAQHAGRGAITDLLQQGRGLGLWCAICVQELAAAKQAIGESAFGNARTILVGRQTADAEEAAALFGSVRTVTRNYQVAERPSALGLSMRRILTGAGSQSWADVYAIHPDALRGLGPGKFAWVTAGEGGGRSTPGWLAVSAPTRSAAEQVVPIRHGAHGSRTDRPTAAIAPPGPPPKARAEGRPVKSAGAAILGGLADDEPASGASGGADSPSGS